MISKMKTNKMMKSKLQWMFAAILMICGVVTLSSCSDDEDNSAAEAVKAQLKGEWYVEYDAAGTLKSEEGNVDYIHVIERYSFGENGEGQWSRYYMNDGAYPVEEWGGVQEGSFDYSVSNDGSVSIHFDEVVAREFPDQRVVNFTDGKLVAVVLNDQKQTFGNASSVMVDAFNEWDGLFHTGDDADGPEDLKDGNRIYGVGYGYNFILDHANALSAAPIIDPKFVDENHKRKTNGIMADIDTKLYTGHSLTEISNELSATAVASGGICGFKGEVGAAFDATYRKSSEYEYAMFVTNISRTSVTLEVDRETTVQHLSPTFKMAVQGETERYKGNKGLYNLISDYGTHFVYQARLGGRVRYTSTVDISKVSGEYDLTAYAKLSYEGLSFSAEGTVDNKYKQSFEKNKSAVNTKVSAMGGTMETLRNVAQKGTKQDLDAWAATLDDIKNTVVVNVEKTFPIWDLVSNDPERAKAIETYVKGGAYERDYSGENNFVIGAMGKISNVSEIFTKADDENGTLVKYIRVKDGSVIAQVCKEYIPQLNPDAASIVFYPMVNGKPKYNLGYFAGNNGARPCRVCWSNAKAEPEIIALSREKNAGLQNELYVLGYSFLHKGIDDATIEGGDPRETETNGFFVEAKGINSNGNVEMDHKYPVVKLFNHIWTRENFSFEIDGVTHKSNNEVYYNHRFMNEEQYRNKIPSGWKLPTRGMFEQLVAQLKAQNVPAPARKMAKGGFVGFNATWSGYMDGDKLLENGINTHFWAIKGNADGTGVDYLAHHYLKLDNETGNLAVINNTSIYVNFSVRLVQDITW